MKKYICYALLFFGAGIHSGFKAEEIKYENGDMIIRIEEGEEWLHDFPLFLGIKIKNAPQIAIWVEDCEGNYLSTLFITKRTATGSWRMAKGNPRKESLPHWSHQHYSTHNQSLGDGITGATPRESFDVRVPYLKDIKQFIVKVEINHSTDFNEAFPKTAVEGDANYSGGKEGSGQPALVYVARIDRTLPANEFKAYLIGHSSPDGTDGKVYPVLCGFTTALHIVKQITISLSEQISK